MTRRTKIVATIGPASDAPQELDRLLGVGVDVIRLNFSHGPLEEHVDRLRRVREAAHRAGTPVGVLADLPGPKVRAGKFVEGGVVFEAGTPVVLVPGSETSTVERVNVEYPTLLDDLAAGDRVMFGDGAISLRVIDVDGEQATAVVETGAKIQGKPGVHLPSERLRLSTPTDEDLVLANGAAQAGVEFVAVSFVRRGADVEKVREVVGDRAQLVAKIETATAVHHLDEIITASDAIMVARGDLGIDLPFEQIPHLQKDIVRRCVLAGVPVITATQMLESMVTNPSPTRAEVTDVANAVFDGTDAVMLSGETAVGRDPAHTVSTMASIASRAERAESYRRWASNLGKLDSASWDDPQRKVSAALTHAAMRAAEDVGAAAILCCTNSGETARNVARFRPEMKLIGLSPVSQTVNALCLTWGVDAIPVATYHSTDDMVDYAVKTAAKRGRIDTGDIVVVIAGSPNRSPGTPADVLRLVTVP